MLKIQIHPKNKQNLAKIKRLVQIVLNYFNIKNVSLSIVFLSTDEMSFYNNKYRKNNSSTDVLAFPSEIENDLGDIFICEESIEYNASIFKENFICELKRVIVHGILHLIGYTDIGQSEKDKMWDIQEKILSLQDVKTIK